MASSFFNVTVTYPDKPQVQKRAQVANGPVTGDWLAAHYQRTNAFPGASDVHIEESEGKVQKLEDIVKDAKGVHRNAKGRKMTPLGKVTKRFGPAPSPEELESLKEGSGSVAKRGVGEHNLPESQGGRADAAPVAAAPAVKTEEVTNGTVRGRGKSEGTGSNPA